MNNTTSKFLFGLIFGLVLEFPLASQEYTIPLEMQLVMLPKVLAFEKNLVERDEQINIGILIDESTSSIENVKRMIASVDQIVKTNQNIPFGFHTVLLDSDSDLETILPNQKFDALFLSHINEELATRVSKFCRRHNIISFSGAENHKNLGISVFFDQVHNKPKLIIDLGAAKAEGANFSSHLLRLATIINEE